VKRGQEIAHPPGAVAFVVSVAVHRLTEQRDFAASLAGKLPRLGQNVRRRPALFWTAHARHDAVRAKLVAADHDSHVRLKRRRPHRRIAEWIEAFVTPLDFVAAAFLAAEADFHPLAASRPNLADQRGHLVQLPRPDDQIDVRRPLEDEPLILLSHAAQNADYFIGVLALGVL
jgi:hypothetical protein